MTVSVYPAPAIDRRYQTPAYDVEFHLAGCDCEHCAPIDDRLTWIDIGNIALAAAIVGSAIAFAIDPHGAWAALADVARSWGR